MLGVGVSQNCDVMQFVALCPHPTLPRKRGRGFQGPVSAPGLRLWLRSRVEAGRIFRRESPRVFFARAFSRYSASISRWLQLVLWPLLAKLSDRRWAVYTERWRPPVQPMPTVR